ncbi:MAG: hydrogenase maturation protease [Planctomycetota bacterium]
MKHQVEITERGYLRLSAATAETLFPEDVLIAMYKPGELLLLPTRGPGGGGLLLKQYTVQGDRAVLLTEVLPFVEGETQHTGTWHGDWDEQAHALRVKLEAQPLPAAPDPLTLSR